MAGWANTPRLGAVATQSITKRLGEGPDVSAIRRIAAFDSGEAPGWVARADGKTAALDLDFLNNRAYVRGVGSMVPADILDVTNANGTYLDSAGVLTTPGANTLRSGNLGARLEAARANAIRNPSGQGATAGTIGSGGTYPTNHQVVTTPSITGLTYEITAKGTDAKGVSYWRWKVSGTPSATGIVRLQFETTTGIVAADGERWTQSLSAALVSGAFTNVGNVLFDLIERTSVGGLVADNNGSNIKGSIGAARSPVISSATLSGGETVARIQPELRVNVTSGQAVDFELEFSFEQLEKQTTTNWTRPTSFVPSNGSALTRAIDVPSLKSAVATACGLASGQGAILVQWKDIAGAVGEDAYIAALYIDDDNTIELRCTSGNKLNFRAVNATSAVADLPSTNNISADTLYRAGVSWDDGDFAASFPISLETETLTADSGTPPSGSPTLNIGHLNGASSGNILLERIAVFTSPLPAEALEAWRDL